MLAPAEKISNSSVWKDGALTVAEASKFVGLGRTKLLELAYSGEVPSTTIGKRRLFARAGLIALLEKGAETIAG